MATEEKMLSSLGYQVTSFISSKDAYKSFQSNPEQFDVVITDMAMPHMPGDELSAKLNKIRPDIPILLCTGFSDKLNSEEDASSLGAKNFLIKPFALHELSQKLRKILD